LLAKRFKCAMDNERAVSWHAETSQQRTKGIQFPKHATGSS
jgi:hypothetical protein